MIMYLKHGFTAAFNSWAYEHRCKRGWFFHREHKSWLIHDHNMEPFVKADAFERGSYYFFDHNTWETGRKVQPFTSPNMFDLIVSRL